MNIVQSNGSDRAYSIVLPREEATWANIFTTSCSYAGFDDRSIRRLSDGFCLAQQVLDGRHQRIDYCSFGGQGAFFTNSIYMRGPARISYEENGDLYIHIHLPGTAQNIANGQSSELRGPVCILTYYPPHTSRIMRVRNDQDWVSASIIVKPKMLVNALGVKPADLPHPLGALLRGAATEGFSMEFPLPGEIVHILNSVWKCDDHSSLRQVMVEAKAREIVYLVLRQAREKAKAAQNQMRAIGVKTAKIEKVQAILESELHVNHSLQSLADRAALSRTSLCLGFRQWSGMAVFEYLHLKRMELAWRALEENRHSVQQIAAMAGYRDESAFSRAFRGHFGIQPTAVSRSPCREDFDDLSYGDLRKAG